MRYVLPIATVLILIAAIISIQAQEPPRPDNTKTRAGEMADTVTSDAPEIEMTVYYIAFLRRGPAWTSEPTPEVQEIQRAHMGFINQMADSGVLVLAGPFLEQTGADALAGMYVYQVGSLDEAEKLTMQDPAVQANRFTVEVVPWFGPVGLTYEQAIQLDSGIGK